MDHQQEVERLRLEVEAVVQKYSKSSDPKVQKLLRRLNRAEQNLSLSDTVKTAGKMLTFAKIIHELWKHLG